jgi:hypothetical protein
MTSSRVPHESERGRISASADLLAAAIGRKDGTAIRALLAPGFVLRTPGGAAQDADQFVAGIEAIPLALVFVRLERVQIELLHGGALGTGIHRAQVRAEGQTVDELRPFVDWFVQDESGAWRVRVALDLPALPNQADAHRKNEGPIGFLARLTYLRIHETVKFVSPLRSGILRYFFLHAAGA